MGDCDNRQKLNIFKLIEKILAQLIVNDIIPTSRRI